MNFTSRILSSTRGALSSRRATSLKGNISSSVSLRQARYPGYATTTPTTESKTEPSTSTSSQLSAGTTPTSTDPLTTPSDSATDWSRSYSGLSEQPFSKEATDVLLAPIDPNDVEMKPDGLIYLPEIKYRRILNRAFGPGGWGLAPRTETNVGTKVVSREYALVCLGRLVAIARGEQEYFDPSGIATATEACKSNALMRCCKDLGIASELWDPRFIREFKEKYCVEVWAEHVLTKKKKSGAGKTRERSHTLSKKPKHHLPETR
ncbi:mitochondrial genome maintenance MGM101 [Marasmius fiardii PR-910]|nr:mitochondrial genome maintenance MGM101 [Marasmius fiardii PR-910]